MEQFLYRGVNTDIHRRNEGKLIPKALGKPFRSHAYWGDAYWNDGSVYGESERNTVIQHQRDSSKHTTSGISTTPSFENACRYATHDSKYATGFVYKIDSSQLETYGVTFYAVEEHATQPAIPGDKEVILVAKDFGVLPSEIVVEVIKISLPNNSLGADTS
jgi:hypothetical protein